MSQRIQHITVKAIISSSDARVLLLKDDKGKWELPGGKIDFGESPEEALVREINEELAVQADVQQLISAWTFTVPKPELEKQYVVLVYRCSIPDGELRLSSEHREYAWYSLEEIKKLDIRTGYIHAIAAGLE